MESPNDTTTTSDVSRRCFLGGCAAVAGASICGTATTATTAASAAPEVENCAKLPPGTVLAKKADVPVNSGIVVYFDDETSVVVAQPKKGTYTAFDARCPHQGCMCSEVTEDNVIICWCHDSRFSSVNGKRQKGPAKKGLAVIKTKIKGDDVVVA